MMAIATILQCKRAFLPHVFVRYCAPFMRDVLGFDLRVFVIQHQPMPMSDGPLETNRSPRGTERVEQRTKDGMYDGAAVVSHSEWFPPLPSLPSVLMAAELGIEMAADYHLWLDDDAIVLDEECSWEGHDDVRVYRVNDIVNQAYFVSSRGFDERVTDMLRTVESDWRVPGENPGHLLEKRLACMCRSKKQLPDRFAARIHQGHGMEAVAGLCRRACPDVDMEQIKEDFE
jgi:hypothetical protein